MSEPTQVESQNPNQGIGRPRRGSFAELFASRPSNAASAPSSSSPPSWDRPSVGSSMASAMAMNQQQGSRRMSITTLGLSGSPTHVQQQSAQGPLRPMRRSSTDYQSNGRNSVGGDEDENAIDDGDTVPPMNGSNSGNNSPPGIVRRLSFGARTFGTSAPTTSERSPSDHRGSISAAAGQLSGGPRSPGSAKREGFNWSESLRNRAQRSSISTGSGNSNGFLPLTSSNNPHNRTNSASGSSGSNQSMPNPQPKSPPKQPDHFQERILKGDFYMD